MSALCPISGKCCARLNRKNEVLGGWSWMAELSVNNTMFCFLKNTAVLIMVFGWRPYSASKLCKVEQIGKYSSDTYKQVLPDKEVLPEGVGACRYGCWTWKGILTDIKHGQEEVCGAAESSCISGYLAVEECTWSSLPHTVDWYFFLLVY